MSRKPVAVENRLILSLAKHGGTATLTEIRRDFYGRLTRGVLAIACRDRVAGLVVFEKSRSKGSKRPTTRLSLTLSGWSAVQFLRPGWQPRRLAVNELKAWLAELQQERDPWAVQFVKDAQDAASWRRAEAARKEKNRLEEQRRAAREKPSARYPSAGRHRSPEELEARREWAASKGFQSKVDKDADEDLNEPTYAVPGAPRIPATSDAPIVPPPSSDYERYVSSTYRAEWPQTGPRTADTPTDPLIERIKRAGYTVRGNQVLYAGERYVTPEEWVQLNPHVNL